MSLLPEHTAGEGALFPHPSSVEHFWFVTPRCVTSNTKAVLLAGTEIDLFTSAFCPGLRFISYLFLCKLSLYLSWQTHAQHISFLVLPAKVTNPALQCVHQFLLNPLGYGYDLESSDG